MILWQDGSANHFSLIVNLVFVFEVFNFGFLFVVTAYFLICDHLSFTLYPVNFDYSYGYREPGERTEQPFPTELNTSMMYYYDDGTGVQVYPVEETLLKEYIKRQM